ncbi:hypothetical protein RJ639_037708 [Escallonia herrerae]|uniref:Major facilitator superfamily domain-containing protein 12-like n=1 Tax=Escallonia herrerae TaxID=1293975 RepID=A0AA88WKI5_9ASTE|nr:hypothetical protein RJ639_037708 [Escallonia herrerae]
MVDGVEDEELCTNVMVDGVGIEELCTNPLGRCSVFYYGVGHMLNDITSACWFTYLLVFLTDIGLSPSSELGSFCKHISVLGELEKSDNSGRSFECKVLASLRRDAAAVMLAGQIADGFTTIIAGELIDRFGHFKIWHGAGSVLVSVSFSSVFGGCLPCKILGNNSTTLQTIGYSFFAAIFNVGWAATQVSHMSMVANLSLYAVALVVFSVSTVESPTDVENQYRWIAFSSIAIGCCFVSIFHLGTKEPRLKQGVLGKSYVRISWTYWFKKVLYYQVALVYVFTRLVTNVSQALLAFYVINDLRMVQSSKALVPAIIYICSFVVSVILQEITWTGQRLKVFYSLGGILWIFCGAGILFLPRSMSAFMYILSVAIGIANALMTVTGISMQSVLVGEDLNGCAFVYGSLSFLDKMSCGLALCILESYQTTSSNMLECNALFSCFSITRYGLGLIPAVCALAGVAVTCTMKLQPPTLKPLMEPLLV